MPPSRSYQKPMMDQVDKANFSKVRTSRSSCQHFSTIAKNVRIPQPPKPLSIEDQCHTFKRSRFESEMNEHLKNLSENVEEDIKKQAKCKFLKYFASTNPTVLFPIAVGNAELLCDLNRKVLNQLGDERKKVQLILEDAFQNIKLLQKKLDQPTTRRKELSQDLQSMNLLLKYTMNK